jgi:rSAM/selenodomain-associated transferase 2
VERQATRNAAEPLRRSTSEGLSVLIPTLDEAERLPAALKSVGADPSIETIVIDGGSTDDTRAASRAAGVKLVIAPLGRARQLNAGAQVAKHESLLFLHADTRLPPGYADRVRALLARPGIAAGAFHLKIDSEKRGIRMVERGVGFRSRWFGMPYGDQALFLRRETFLALGGFRELEIMEDYDLVRRLRRLGRIALVPDAVRTSGRRWERLGVWRTTLFNQLTVLGFHLGVPTRKLARWYAPERAAAKALASRLSDC